MIKDDGGPAFPGQIPTGAVYLDPALGRNVAEYEPVQGMSLRDYFAAKAMLGYLAYNAEVSDNNDKLAEWSYATADAMIRARKV
jgi:hypothetical protein